MLLYSQAATAKAITPAIVTALGITAANPDDSYMLVASFAAVSALFVLPTYPTLLGRCKWMTQERPVLVSMCSTMLSLFGCTGYCFLSASGISCGEYVLILDRT